MSGDITGWSFGGPAGVSVEFDRLGFPAEEGPYDVLHGAARPASAAEPTARTVDIFGDHRSVQVTLDDGGIMYVPRPDGPEVRASDLGAAAGILFQEAARRDTTEAILDDVGALLAAARVAHDLRRGHE